MSLKIKRGSRAFIAGKTGSGKTRAALFLLHYLTDYPVFILDTKIEPAFKKVLGKNAEIIDGVANYDPLKARKPFVILRPTGEEAVEPAILDELIFRIHDRVEGCTLYIDEAYQVHVNGRAGAGLVGILTRGRSRDQTVITSTQRPVWISRFCLTEADSYFIFRLSDRADRLRLREVIPDDQILQTAGKYHFWHFSQDEDEAEYYAPFPLDVGDATRADLAKISDGTNIAERRKNRLRLV